MSVAARALRLRGAAPAWLGLIGAAVALAPWGWLAGAAAAALALLSPAVALGWLVLSVSAQDALRLGGLTLTQLAAPLALASWAIWLAARPQRRLGLGATALAWLALLCALLLSVSLSAYPLALGLGELWRWGLAGLAWLIAATCVRRPWQLALLLACLLLGPLANAALGLAQTLSGDGPPAFRLAPGSPYVRAYGTIGQPNSFAGYLNMAWPLALALACGASAAAWRARGPAQAWRAALALALWAASATLLAALAASFSRGAWLGAAAGLVGMAAALGRRGRLAGGALALALALLVGLSGRGLLPGALDQRLASISGALTLADPSATPVTPQNFAVLERAAQLWAGWGMASSHPLLGVGPGAYSAAYQRYAAPPWFASRGHAHNAYLQIAAEAGLVGLAAYLVLLACTLRDARRALAAPGRRVVAVGLCGIIAAVAAHQLFEHLHVLHLSIQSAAAWGALAALGRSPGGEE